MRPHLPNNKEQALSRLSPLRHTLEKKPKMKEQEVAPTFSTRPGMLVSTDLWHISSQEP